jgi:heat shock protein HslJ
MALEQAYLKALESTGSYTVTTGSLSLFDTGGKKILTYKEGKTVSLTGVTWNVTSYYNGREAVTGVINGTTITASFAADGRLTGSTGINDYVADYKVDGRKISITAPTLTTGNPSQDAAVTQQQSDFLAALPLAIDYEIKGTRLDLFRPGNTIAVTSEQAE